jgi:2-(1,2-epoxy-1,2-dihydrophenyl)acetyl-CoA isomerase
MSNLTLEKERTLLEITDGVGIITLNNPKAMNALDTVLFTELSESTEQLLDDPDVKVIVLTGVGNAFCAGGDLKRLSEGFSPAEGLAYMKSFHPWVSRMINSEKPTIAAVNGFAVGAGFCIAMMADIVYAAEEAKFGMAFNDVGLIPDLAGLYTLPRIVGLQRAKELVLTGRKLTAEQARDWGIATEVFPADQLMEQTLKIAKRFANGPLVAQKFDKLLLNSSLDLTLEQMFPTEAAYQALCFQTKDHLGATKAFFNKEKPVFTGE